MLWRLASDIMQYQEGIKLMHFYLDQVINKEIPSITLLLEHYDIYTAGRSAKQEEASTNIPIIYSDRGGRFTYHGPGQRVVYPIIDLRLFKDIKKYLEFLEIWIINTLKILGIHAYAKNGVWVNVKCHEKKIAFIGIRVRKWVAYHGFAVNINTDLDKYKEIIPCGIYDCGITSLKDLGCDVTLHEFDEILKQEYYKM